MTRSHFIGALKERDGSSFLTVLVMITICTVIFSIIMAIYLAQYRFVRADVHALQAQYSAEAGLHVALDSLQRNPHWRVHNHLIDLPLGKQARVTVESHGGFLFVRSIAEDHNERYTLRALAGAAPSAMFDDAVWLWDAESSLHLAGSTAITGDVVVGERGVKESTFKGERFVGGIDGKIHRLAAIRPPYFNPGLFEESMDSYDAILERGGIGSHAAPYLPREAAGWMPSDFPVYFVDGDLTLSEVDQQAILSKPITIAATGDLTMEGNLHAEAGTRFLAGGGLWLEGEVRGRGLVFYGQDGVVIGHSAVSRGQFLTRNGIFVGSGVYLKYPSVLYTSGHALRAGGKIVIQGDAIVEGSVIHPQVTPAPEIHRGRIVVEDEALVRGSLFNMHETELHGTVIGSVLTHQFYFYHSPTSYINWLKDARVNHTARPVDYVLPLRFREQPRLAVLLRHGFGESIAGEGQ